jgi:glycosyltransferase involved in cell wall biosynthesis
MEIPKAAASSAVAPESIWVVVPAFNEATALASVLQEVMEPGYRVVVVDDGSSDSTAQTARSIGVTVIRHCINLGQGAALQTGIRWAISQGASYICTYDADGQHRVTDIALMAERMAATSADVTLGSRFLGQTHGMPAVRKFLLKLAIAFTTVHSGLRLTDTHNGLRLFTRDAALRLNLQQPRMAHASEILARIAECRFKYIEVPTSIRYTDYSRQKGQSALGSFRILFDLLIARALK